MANEIKINLKERVEVELIKDMPSMRKFKGDIIKTHPLNITQLAKVGYIKAPAKGK